MSRVVIIVQARMGSQRFPGKVLAPLLGQPMLLWVLARLSRVQTPHTLVVATPAGTANHPIADLCIKHGYLYELVDVPEEDVLARFCWVAERYRAERIVRVCGDSPTIDPAVIDALLAAHAMEAFDLTATAEEWPDGCDVEVMARRALDIAERDASAPSEREHVSSYIWSRPEKFVTQTLPCPFDLHDVQWSVDEPTDLQRLESLLVHTCPRTGPVFGWQDLMVTMALHPYLSQAIRSRPPRNRAYTAQVARERGTTELAWDMLRYGGLGGRAE